MFYHIQSTSKVTLFKWSPAFKIIKPLPVVLSDKRESLSSIDAFISTCCFMPKPNYNVEQHIVNCAVFKSDSMQMFTDALFGVGRGSHESEQTEHNSYWNLSQG